LLHILFFLPSDQVHVNQFCFTSRTLLLQIKSKGVTMTALLAKATALALAKHPTVNSCCKDGKSFTYNSSINISVAVSIDGGLITPVLQNADKVRRALN
jgi:pyruvate dehydrogenase E2 component (dihydrolipoamide acetyltransferase)